MSNKNNNYMDLTFLHYHMQLFLIRVCKAKNLLISSLAPYKRVKLSFYNLARSKWDFFCGVKEVVVQNSCITYVWTFSCVTKSNSLVVLHERHLWKVFPLKKTQLFPFTVWLYSLIWHDIGMWHATYLSSKQCDQFQVSSSGSIVE